MFHKEYVKILHHNINAVIKKKFASIKNEIIIKNNVIETLVIKYG